MLQCCNRNGIINLSRSLQRKIRKIKKKIWSDLFSVHGVYLDWFWRSPKRQRIQSNLRFELRILWNEKKSKRIQRLHKNNNNNNENLFAIIIHLFHMEIYIKNDKKKNRTMQHTTHLIWIIYNYWWYFYKQKKLNLQETRWFNNSNNLAENEWHSNSDNSINDINR